MANITILSRQNVVEFLKSKVATKMDFVKSKEVGEGNKPKFFFALNNSEQTVLPDGRTVSGTRGAISKALQEEIAAGKALNINDVIVADTVMEGSSKHCWLLMKAGESNTVGGFAL